VPRVERLSLAEFEQEYFQKSKPVVILRAIDSWKAFTNWNRDYFVNKFGNFVVPVETGPYSENPDKVSVPFGVYLDTCVFDETENSNSHIKPYLAQYPLFDEIPELREDIEVPEYCDAGKGSLYLINAWIGPKGTVTPLHCDPHHNIFAQIKGRKYFRIYKQVMSDKLYLHTSPFLKNTSQVDVENVDRQRFPLFDLAPYEEGIIGEGELLYIPKAYYHYVRALDSSFSVNFWFR